MKYNEENKDKEKVLRLLLTNLSLLDGKSCAYKSVMGRSYQYFHGSVERNEFDSIYESFSIKSEGETLSLPMISLSYNKIKSKIKSIVGDLIDMGFEAHVEGINKDVVTRKYESKVAALAKYELRGALEYAAAQTGIEYGIDNDIPASIEELEEKFKEYKDLTELAMEACLNVSLQNCYYHYTRLQLFMDAVIAGECHAFTDIVDGEAIISRENPFDVFYPTSRDDNDFLDKTYQITIVKYEQLSDVLKRNNITEEQWKELEAKATAQNTLFNGITYENKSYLNRYDERTGLVSSITHFYMDYKKISGVEREDKDGNTTFIIDYENNNNKTYPKEDENGILTNVTRKRVGILCKAKLIGGFFLEEYGKVKNQHRHIKNYAKALCNVTSYRPYYIQGESKSEVQLISQIQDFRDYCLNILQLELTKSGGQTLAIDVSKLPADWGDPQTKIKSLLYHLKAMNLVVYDSSQGEIPDGNAMPVSRFDMGIGSLVGAMMNLLPFLDSEMESVSGINDARLGNIQNNQLASVTAMSLAQSNKISKYLFNGFFEFESRLLTKHAQHIKTSWILEPERWLTAVGDKYMDFLMNDSDLTLDDHSIVVKSGVMSRTDLKQYLMAALEHGFPLEDALEIEILARSNIKEAVAKFIKGSRKRKEMEAMQQQQMQQMQMQAMQAQDANRQQSQMAIIDKQGQNELQKTNMKGGFDLQKTMLKEKKNQLRDDYPLYTEQ